MIAQPRVDLHRDALGAVALLGAVVEEAARGGGERGDEDDEANEARRERQQPVCP